MIGGKIEDHDGEGNVRGLSLQESISVPSTSATPPNAPKIFLMFGRDMTVAALLSALGSDHRGEWPGYGSAVVLELWRKVAGLTGPSWMYPCRVDHFGEETMMQTGAIGGSAVPSLYELRDRADAGNDADLDRDCGTQPDKPNDSTKPPPAPQHTRKKQKKQLPGRITVNRTREPHLTPTARAAAELDALIGQSRAERAGRDPSNPLYTVRPPPLPRIRKTRRRTGSDAEAGDQDPKDGSDSRDEILQGEGEQKNEGNSGSDTESKEHLPFPAQRTVTLTQEVIREKLAEFLIVIDPSDTDALAEAAMLAQRDAFPRSMRDALANEQRFAAPLTEQVQRFNRFFLRVLGAADGSNAGFGSSSGESDGSSTNGVAADTQPPYPVSGAIRVPDLPQPWLDSIMHLLPAQLVSRYPETVRSLCDELRLEFRNSARQSAIYQILRRPDEAEEHKKLQQEQQHQHDRSSHLALPVPLTALNPACTTPSSSPRPSDLSMALFHAPTLPPPLPAPWRPRYLVSHVHLLRSLRSYHPCLLEVLELWRDCEAGRVPGDVSTLSLTLAPTSPSSAGALVHLRYDGTPLNTQGMLFVDPMGWSARREGVTMAGWRNGVLVQAERGRERWMEGFLLHSLRLLHTSTVVPARRRALSSFPPLPASAAKPTPGDLATYRCADTLFQAWLLGSTRGSVEEYVGFFPEVPDDEERKQFEGDQWGSGLSDGVWAETRVGEARKPRFVVRLALNDGYFDQEDGADLPNGLHSKEGVDGGVRAENESEALGDTGALDSEGDSVGNTAEGSNRPNATENDGRNFFSTKLERAPIATLDPTAADLSACAMEGLRHVLETVESVPYVGDLLWHKECDSALGMAVDGTWSPVKIGVGLAGSGDTHGQGDERFHFKPPPGVGEQRVGMDGADLENVRREVSARISYWWTRAESWVRKRYEGIGRELKRATEVVAKGKRRVGEKVETQSDERVDEEALGWEGMMESITLVTRLKFSISLIARAASLPMIRISAGDLHAAMQDKCEGMREELIGRVVKHCIEKERKYETIAQAALRIPDSFQSMADQISYMQQASAIELPALLAELEEAREKLDYIISLSALNDELMRVNADAFTWPRRIEEVMERHEQIVLQAKDKNQQVLRERREKFVVELQDISKQITELADVGDLEELPFYMKKVQTLHKTLTGAVEVITGFNKEETLFGWEITQYPARRELLSRLEPFQNLYSSAISWTKSFKKWMDGPLQDLDSEGMEAEVDSVKREMFRAQAGLAEGSAPRAIADLVLEKIGEFGGNMPIVRVLCNPGLRERHWKKIGEVAGVDISPDQPGVNLRKILKLGLEQHLTAMQEISGELGVLLSGDVCVDDQGLGPQKPLIESATKEFTLEKTLNKMVADWAPLLFTILPYRESGTFILSAVDEAQQLLDDQIVKTQSMRGSPYIKPFEVRCKEWEARLLRTQEIIDEWLKMQATWLYLEPIFSSEDIMNQMPEEGKKFKQVDFAWRKQMKIANEDSHVLAATDIPNFLEDLKHNNEMLEEILKGLNNYLEVKRLYFPRFFFLSNDEMLEILSETKDPQRVQPHLKKCFEGVNSLEFTENMDITSLFSAEGEKLPLDAKICTVDAKGSVEKWLLQVEQQMLVSVRSVTEHAVRAYVETPRKQWVLDWPGQVVLCVGQVFWTLAAEKALAEGKGGMERYYKLLNEELSDVIKLVRGNLSKQARITLGALVVIDVHARDVIQNIIKEKVTDVNDFNWLAQLRYYWQDENVVVKMVNTRKLYGYEYLGNTGRLVVTPLTDRCYRTLLGALHLNLGGAPEGPAGTGKTETTKDLAKALAKQCVVFNCSDGLDYLAMGKFFKGVASAGAWACFDEFNRIDLEVSLEIVLSVVAQQILTIQRAVALKAEKFYFEGTELRLNPTCAVFITMNPGYAGRSELPDNLKALFRSVAMMVPDYTLIAEISLYSFGFIEARLLARKITATYRLCSEQLSSQSHYDYGMRAVKSVLTAAGNIKLKYPDEDENILVLRSIIDVNLPKFLAQDVELFRAITTDLFPGVKLPTPDYRLLEAAIMKACEKLGLQCVPVFLEKTLQLYEMMLVRHGYMLVGEPFCGKTSSYRVLGEALTEMANAGVADAAKVQYRVLNPKSITMGQLYGQFDPISHEWTDGVLATTFRNFASNPSPDRKWVIFDGPVDAIWIENMNTVLDDNKKLCLMSGEIIQMSSVMSLVFEVMDLAVASVSSDSADSYRISVVLTSPGMPLLSQPQPEKMGWRPLVTSWLQKLSFLDSSAITLLNAAFESHVPSLLQFVRKECKELAPTTDIGLVNSLVQLLDAQLDAFRERIVPQEKMPNILRGHFIFSVIWSIGGSLDTAGMEKFDKALRVLCASESLDWGNIGIPGDGLVYDYQYDPNSPEKWREWLSTVDAPSIPLNAEFSSIIVGTKDTVRCNFLIDLLVLHDKPFLLVGPTGTGKSKYITDKLLRLPGGRFQSNFLTFSARTSANQTQDIVMSKLDKRRKGVFGPPMGKKTIVFVDDLNMPATEQYGAQPPIELLRQFFDHANWYDRKDTSKLELVDVLVVSAMGPPGGGRSAVTPRLIRHFNQLAINSFDDNSMTRIFGSIMRWHLGRFDFEEPLKSLGVKLVEATSRIYKWSSINLLPTPAKTHYTFNLRDFSKVVQGLVLSKPKAFPSSDKFVRLWVHEVLRVFGDRLVTEDDSANLFKMTMDVVQSVFGNPISILSSYLQPESTELKDGDLRGLVFGDVLSGARGPDMLYDELTDLEKVTQTLTTRLTDYNNQHKAKLNLVLFRFAVEHIAKICRVLRLPGGNALLVGVGGSGRQSLSRLAAFMADYELVQIELSKQYGKAEWRDDLKKTLRLAGMENRGTVFLFADTQIKDESFVEDIASILNAGDVPNLFALDEKQAITERVAPDAQAENLTGDTSPNALYGYFISRVQRNLHIILAMSPIGDAFRTRLRQFASLVNCTTIDWMQQWPQDALSAVASSFLADVELDPSIRPEIVQACQYFHQSTVKLSSKFREQAGRYNYVTPTSYLELLLAYKQLLSQKRDEVSLLQKRYSGGLEKLRFAAESVETMKIQLSDLQPQLVRTAEETATMLSKIQLESVDANKTKETVAAEESVASLKAEQASAIKAECEGELAIAMPLLNAALTALDTLQKKDIDTVKAMKNPPEGVKLVLEAVCVLRDIKPEKGPDPSGSGKMILDYWKTSLKMLSDTHFLDALKSFDKDNIAPQVIKNIRMKYVPNPEFRPDKVKNASSAAEGLCQWILALEGYDRVIKVVAPKQEALKKAEEEVNGLMARLNEKRAQLKEVEDRLQSLNDSLQALNDKKTSLESEQKRCVEQLDRANTLLGGLGGEQQRWTDVSKSLTSTYFYLTGDVLIAAGYVAYLGAFTKTYRKDAVKEWVEFCKAQRIPCSDSFTLAKVLGDPIKIRSWNLAGLPADDFSVDNGITVYHARRWPLMIDPQGQANKWVKNMEKDSNLQTIKLTDSDYLRTLENAITFGNPVLIENIKEDLDPILEPLLQKQTFRSAGSLCIKLGDNVVEYSEKFKLYITTKFRNPHYMPELSTKVSLLNFMITPEGLEDQLLGIVVLRERPELEDEKSQLLQQSADNKRKLKEIEDKILYILSSSEGNILENEAAIDALSSSKVISDGLFEKQRIAEETEKKIDETRESYRPIANHSAVLFFCIADLANIDPMYQYSLTWFIDLFANAISQSNKSRDVKRRLKNLESFFTYSLYQNVCRSLFEKDKLLFSFGLCLRILKNHGEITEAEQGFLLTGGIGLENPHPNPDPLWLSDKSWGEVCRLADIEAFSDIKNEFKTQVSLWHAWSEAVDPWSANLPGRFATSLSEFQKLLLVRCLQPEKIVACVMEFVKLKLGPKFIEPPPFDLSGSYEDSSARTPLIFVLSPGVDPMAGLLKFADDKGFTGSKLQAISLGQGQGPLAAAMIKDAQKAGTWVVLQNCHLAPSWLSQLEKIADDMSAVGVSVHKDFRLWLTSYPSPSFPASILQNGVKMTNEPPRGIRANLLRSYGSDPISDTSFFNGCPTKPGEWEKLLFGLCFFHAVVQYGGRVTDDWDRRTLATILSNVYTPGTVEDGNYKFSSSGLYYSPTKGNYQSYIDFIKGLPMIQKPEVFGIHENGDIARQISETKNLFDSMLRMQEKSGSSSSGGSGKSSDQVLIEVITDILSKVPKPFDVEIAAKKYPVNYNESMNTEMIRFNRLLQVILGSLANVQKALKGLVVMSAELDGVAQAMLVGRVPAMWTAKSFASLKPLGSYVTDLIARLKFFQAWYDKGGILFPKNESKIIFTNDVFRLEGAPTVQWMSGFFFTQSFITATLQNYARRHSIPIDELSIDFQVMSDMSVEHPPDKPPESGVYVSGLFLEGARWRREDGLMGESLPKVLYDSMPVMWFKPIRNSDLEARESIKADYVCPIYKTSARRGILSTTGHSTNFVLPVRLPTDKPTKHWIMRGVAILLQLDD
ncbi:Dynein heavy chain 7, axonemal [Gonapodya sp. JEL0774]|nr:Dynein heavy chain 7, axonemal [Gonapodya sp. JEL0774]